MRVAAAHVDTHLTASIRCVLASMSFTHSCTHTPIHTPTRTHARTPSSDWEIRDLLFQVDLVNKPKRSKSVFNAALLRRLATLAGMDTKAFSVCFYSKRYIEEVKRVSQVSREIGVIGTPHYVINNRHVEGVVEAEDFIKTFGRLHKMD